VTENDTKRGAVGYAVALIGSVRRAAEYLGVGRPELGEILRGSQPVPEPVFLRALDLLMTAKAAELDAARTVLQASDLPRITAELELLLKKPQ
jgi:hypothetical protein